MSEVAALAPTYADVCLHKLESLCYKRGGCQHRGGCGGCQNLGVVRITEGAENAEDTEGRGVSTRGATSI